MAAHPYPPGLPHIGYILLWYPLFTQPFIFREVENLKNELPVQIYTLYGENLRYCSQEMRAALDNVRHYGMKALFPIVGNAAKMAGLRPGFVGRLFRQAMFHKWPTLEVFGENLWAFFAGLTLGRQIRDDGIDIIYAPWPRGAATAAWVASQISGLPFAIAARGDNLDPADPDLGAKLEAAAFIRTNNAADKARIEKLGNAAGKTCLVYNSLTLGNCLNKHVESDSGQTKLLAIGRFDVTKGFDDLLKACALLKERGLDFHLTLVGGGGKVMGLGNLEKDLRQLRENLGLADVVSMPGLVSHDDLPALLSANDIFIAPCVIHESGRRDGIPNTVIEAMACAMPVVSTNVNALPEVVINGETGLSVPQHDPASLADAIFWLARHKTEAREMGKRGASLAERMFNPQANARKLAALFIEYYKSGTVKCAV